MKCLGDKILTNSNNYIFQYAVFQVLFIALYIMKGKWIFFSPFFLLLDPEILTVLDQMLESCFLAFLKQS